MYEIFEKLCSERNVTPYKVSQDTKIATSTLSDWKSGKSVPKLPKLMELAKYFGVSLDYLVLGEDAAPDKKYYYDDETAAMAQTLFENRNLRVLFDAAQDASPEDLQTTYNMLLALKGKERGEK